MLKALIGRLKSALQASEQRFELALQASADGMWDWDLTTGRIWFSPRWKEQLGYADHEVANTVEAWKSLIFPEDLEDALRRIADYNEGRIPAFDAVQRFLHRDGHTVYIHSRAVHQKDAAGRVVRMVGAHTDITERHVAQLRLSESEARLRALAAGVPGMMFRWEERRDGGCGFVWVGPGAKALFRVEPEILLADWTAMRLHPDDMELWRAGLQTAAAAGVDWEFEGRAPGPGATRWIKGLAKPVADDDGVIFSGVLFDVTAERLLREETDRLRNRLDFLLNAGPAVISAGPVEDGGRPSFISAGVRRFGYQPAALMAEKDWWATRVHPDDRSAVATALADLPLRGSAELSYRFQTGDGGWRWIVDQRALVADEDGRPVEVVGAMTDVTVAVAAERRADQAQDRLELVLQSAGEGIYGVDLDDRIIFANEAARRMTGYSKEELLGVYAHTLLHHSHEDGAAYAPDECPVRRTCRDGQPRSGTDEVFWRKDGGCFPVEFVTSPMRDGDRLVGAVVVFRDVADARRVRRELQNSLRRWEAVTANSPVGVAVLDLERRFISVNGAFCKMLAYAPDDLLGLTTQAVYASDEEYRRVGIEAYPVLKSGGVYHTELQLRRSDGGLVWVSVTGSSMDPADLTQGGVWVLEDISQRKADEQALQEKTVELERSNAELEAFAYVASHDLRQPLRTVTSYLTLLERRLTKDLPDDAREFLAFARSGAQRMDRLIVDLLEYSRVGRLSKPHRKVQIGEAAARAAQVLRVALADAGGTIDIADDLPPVFGDDGELERLFVNLFGNAIKYHAPDRPPRIAATAVAVGDGWRFAVADNGIGVPESQFERIFGIFQRLHAADAYEGSGVGLAICRKIVERHGGRIWVESVEGEGCAFHFTLPKIP